MLPQCLLGLSLVRSQRYGHNTNCAKRLIETAIHKRTPYAPACAWCRTCARHAEGGVVVLAAGLKADSSILRECRYRQEKDLMKIPHRGYVMRPVSSNSEESTLVTSVRMDKTVCYFMAIRTKSLKRKDAPKLLLTMGRLTV